MVTNIKERSAASIFRDLIPWGKRQV